MCFTVIQMRKLHSVFFTNIWTGKENPNNAKSCRCINYVIKFFFIIHGVPFVSPSLTSTFIINSPGKSSARFRNFDKSFVFVLSNSIFDYIFSLISEDKSPAIESIASTVVFLPMYAPSNTVVWNSTIFFLVVYRCDIINVMLFS